MPPHPNLAEEDLDALVAHFRAISVRRFDPGAHVTGGGTR
jgi:hypothetical protein